MSIADKVRQAALNKANKAAPQGDQTAQAAQQIATAATGKGQSASEAQAVNNLAERRAMQQTQAAQTAQTEQAVAQADQVLQAETQAQSQQADIEAAERIKETQRKLDLADQQDQLISQIEYSDAQLEDREDQIQVESVMRNLRMENDKYLNDLKIAGETERLDNKQDFTTKIRDLTYSDTTKRLMEYFDELGILDVLKNEQRLEREIAGLRSEDARQNSAYAKASTASNIKSAANVINSFTSGKGKQ